MAKYFGRYPFRVRKHDPSQAITEKAHGLERTEVGGPTQAGNLNKVDFEFVSFSMYSLNTEVNKYTDLSMG